MSTLGTYLTPNIRRPFPSAQASNAAPTALQSLASLDTHTDLDINSVEPLEEVEARADRRSAWATFHRAATLTSVSLCAAALWTLAWQNAQIARLNQIDGRLQSQVVTAHNVNLTLHDEAIRLTDTTRILRIVQQLHMQPSSEFLQMSVHS